MLAKPTKNILLVLLCFLANQAIIAQSNPIIDLVNNPNNNVDGNISTCANDGSLLPKIFLCGDNDVADLTVSYPGAQSIAWQKLDVNSCTNFGDDCTNRSPSCSYSTLSSGNAFVVNDEGKYRLRVDQGNGVFENHYFHVYQNSLEVLYQTADIGCEPTGNITVTNLGSNYGFQLVNADSNQILVPFSADNGPAFIITADGNYRIETMQLNPNTGEPIENGCLFSTPDIAIGTSNFQVQATSTEADCDGVGTVTVTASNGTPNYAYELRLDDGLDGGRGTLIDVVTNQTANTYTFTGVGQGDYLLVGRNSDGCEQSAPTTVVVDPDNTLTFDARVSQHITCKEGNILVDPDGGKPPYRYAVWKYVDESDNVITTYDSPSDIPNSEFQTREIMDVLDPGNYSFVVIDRFGCFTISNSVDIEFVPPAEFDIATVTNIACFGDASGEIQMNLIDSNGYQIQYYLFDDTITTPEANADGFSFAGAIAFNSSGYFPGLIAGEYTVVANMRKGSAECNFAENMLVTAPSNGLAGEAIVILPYTCTQTGTIRADNYGGGTPFPYGVGVPGYDFSLNGSQWQSGNDTFIGLQPGIYTIFIRDSQGCSIETNSVEILAVDSPDDLVFSSTQITCNDPTSDVTVTIVGGTADYTIQITSPSVQSSNSIVDNVAVFENLTPGTYTFEVTDVNDCTYEESFTILPITEIGVVGELLENVSCSGLSDGALRYTVNGFETTYSYTVIDGLGTTIASASSVTNSVIPLNNQPGETYTITVTDDITTCSATTTITIEVPDTPLTATLEVTDLSCTATGTNPGSVMVTAIGGWGGYQYELEDPSGTVVGPQPTSSFTGLTDTSGNYTVTVTDTGGCEVTQTFVLTPVVVPVLEVMANSLCYDSANGLTLTANVTSGGEAPFQYRLAGGAYQSNPVFSGLAPGNYTVEVIDSKNCTASESIEIFPTLTAAANLVKDLDCSATPDAEISISISGGNPTFTYEVIRDGNSVQATTPVPSIPFSYFTTTAGIYEFIITDIESCTVTTNQISVTANTAPTSIEVITEPSCNTSSDGIAELQISGGTPPYQIVFDGSAPSAQTTYPGLVAGTYNYTVTDQKGCVLTDQVTLTAPDALIPGTIDVLQDYRCDNSSAILQVINYSGGTPGYTFSIDGVNFQPSDTFSTGITAGQYTITVRDANGCTEQTPATIIDPLNPPSELTFTATASTCPAIVSDVTVTVVDGTGPFTYEITAPASATSNTTGASTGVFTGLTAGTYTFHVIDSRACEIEQNYTVVDIPEVSVLSQLTSNVSCVGTGDGEFSFTVSDFASTYSYIVENSGASVVQSQNNINVTTAIAVGSLPADTYTVTITDDTTNCTATTVTTINEPATALDFTFTNTPVTCIENATITVTPIGGWGGYEYQLENTVGPALVYAYQSNNVFTNVPAGSYTIYVRDSGGCVVDKPITIDPADAPTIALDPTSDFCYDGTDQASLVINVTDGIAPYSYRIDGGNPITAIGNPFTISNLIPKTYTIQVIDAYGCVSNILTETINPHLTASAVVTKALDCSASPDAIIDVTISNGYTPYATYEVSSDGGGSWGAPVAIVGSNFSYSTAVDGTYDFRITDNSGCAVITQATVAPILNPVITSLVQTTDILCNGDAGATIQVNLDPSQGVAPFTIAVVNTTTATNYGTQTSGLPAGTYEVTITDSNACTDMDVIVITEPDVITYAIALTDIQCDAAGTDPTNNTIPGSISVTNVAGGTVEYTYYLTANNGMPTQTYTTSPGSRDHTFTILNFGIYHVEIIDANGCTVTSNEIIASPPDDLDIDVSTVTTDCSVGGTAIVSVSSAFSSNDYEFAILEYFSPPYSNNYQGPDVVNGDTATFTGLVPGTTYTFVVFDNATRCYYFETADAPIDSPSNLTSTLDAVNNVSCKGSADGSVSFTFDNYDSGATGVSYEIFNAQSNISTGLGNPNISVNPPAPGTGVQISNAGPLLPGVYYILFTELNGAFPGCSVASEQFTIEEASVQLVANANLVKNDNCNLNAGEVSASGQFGRAPYEFQIALSTDTAPTQLTWAGSSTNVFNVEGGNYIVYVKDAFGCIQPAPVLVPTDPEPEISVVVPNECTADEGAFSSVITLDVAGIVPHAIRVDGGAPQAAPALVNAGDTMTISNLSSGPHSIEILDLNGCGEIENFTIYPPLTIYANITAGENCDPANSGEVSVFANGGSGNYSFSQITPAGATNTTGIFTGLTHSIAYTFEARDTTTNCSEQVTITIPTPAIPTFTLTPTPVSCFGGSDGTITVNLLAGNIDTPYSYSRDGGTTTQTSNVFNGLAAGTYTITVISDKGCQDTDTIDIAEPTQLDISANRSDFSCDDDASTITVTINETTPGNPSGTAPYAYSFDNGVNFQPTNTYQVPFGSPDINVVVRDANGCLDTEVVSIPIRQDVTATITADAPIDCADNQQVISINAIDGSGNYTYTELPSGATVADPNAIILNQPGTYVYEVLDTTTNCSVTVEHIIAPYDVIEVTATVASEALCSDSTDGTIEVTITGYTGTFDYEVLDASGNAIAGTADSDNATSDPYVFTVSTTVDAGIYSVQISETAFPECDGISNQVTVDAPEPLSLQLVSNVNANCNEANAIVTVQATGGTAPYSYGVSVRGAGDPGAYPFDNTVELDPTTGLDWDIYVRDANNCVIALPLEITVDTDTIPDIALAIDDECAAEGAFDIIVSLDAVNFGIAPYTMSIDGGAFESIGSFPHTYSNQRSGSHIVVIRDANNCGETENIIIDPELLISTLVVTQPTCTTNDGVIEFTITGGDASNMVTLLNAGTLTDTGLTPTGNQFVGVGSGDYIVRVTDTPLTPSSCFADAPVSLEIPTPVTLLPTDWTDISCTGASDGTITINLEPSSVGVNDNPIYSYTIENTTLGSAPVNQDTALFTNLAPGVYNITVTSGRDCIATDQVEIVEPNPLTADNPVVNPFTCDVNNLVNVATIDVANISGGTSDYFYSVDGTNYFPISGTSFSHSVTVSGDYTFIIRDDNGCELPLPTVTVEPLPVITLSVTEGFADCPTGQEISVTSTGHSTPTDLTFELLEKGEIQANLTSSTATFNLTDPGTYNIKVTDNVTGCYELIGYEIDPRPQWDIALTATTPITCFGDTNGTLEVTFTGYAGAYDYEVFNEDGTTAGVSSTGETLHPLLISNMPAGNYYVSVTPTDYPYCEVKETLVATIQSPIEPLTAVTEDLLASGCPNDMGEISVVPEGGYAPYDITLTPSSGSPIVVSDVFAHVFTRLPAGGYTILVVDSQGCPWNGTGNVALTPDIDASATGTPPVCFDDPDGIIVANATGGSGEFNYFINYYDETGTSIEFTPSVPQQSNEFNFLGEGYYSITVTDDMGCSDTTAIIFLDGPDQLLAEVALTTAMTCDSPAIVTATAAGGTAPYLYQLEDDSGNIVTAFQSNNVFSVSDAGTYRVRITDANNCETLGQVPVVVPEIPPVQLTIDFASTSVSCADDMTASIYASAIGGIGEYTFDLILGGTVVQSQIDFRKVVFEDLAPGEYTVRVTSEGGCPPDEELVSISNPEPLIYNSEVTPETCVDEQDGSITLMLSGGGGGYQYSISPNLDQFFNEDPEQGLPTGQYRFEDLAPGVYTIIAQDSNGCFFVREYPIEPATEMMINIETTPETCEGDMDGSITLDISGGTAPYSTRLSTESSFIRDRLTFPDMAAGAYIIFVEDANGCPVDLGVTIEPGVNLNAIVEPIYECTGNIPENYINITFEDPNIIGDVLYALDSTDPNDLQLTPDFRNIAPGSHYLRIQHSGGCPIDIPFEIQAFDPLTLMLEQNNLNEITAIADGGEPAYTFYFNDYNNGSDNTYHINRSGTYVVRVIDQNGCEAMANIEMEFIDIEIPNFFTPDGDGQNDRWLPENTEGWPEIVVKIYDRYGRVVADDVVNRNGWDGLYKNSELPTGDYWYVIKLHGENDDREFVGHFTLYR
ncbi:T9SS type B sorting domain-containing protein [Maribacter algarum]|uniref:T9SS type B sorting domain-containing protein n=1 Tax=Maribacter algarum (ex Zhang et al. 2020) TaxID=2578118 RepID=A0A5S3PPT0_9FLAO|nr:T9SS type B sorting domain-containing protein [Maribacter algarum]TMM56681.1 T9SS type B sorting domain-containing protein [Maribacter algarum]